MPTVASFPSLLSHSFPYFCFISKSFIRVHQRRLFLYNFIGQLGFCNALAYHSSLQDRTYLNLESLVSSLIVAINSCCYVSCCRAYHGRIIKSVNYSHGYIGDQLVSKYIKLGCVEDAEKLFGEIPDKDVISWNSLISGFWRKGFANKCLNVFRNMRSERGMKLNEVTLISVISACIDMGALDEGKCIHGLAVKMDLLFDAKVVNSLINMYGKPGSLDASCRLFEEMPVQNLVSWNSMIAIYAQNGSSEEGMELFNMMRRARIKSDQATVVSLLQACVDLGVGKLAEAVHGFIISCGFDENLLIATTLLNMYAKLGRLNASRGVFGEIVNPDRIAWTAMLAGYAVHGFGREAIQLFELMVKEGVEPDHVTFTHLLSACSHSGLVKEGKNYLNIMFVVYGVEPRLDHYSCMVDLLGRSGNLNEAYELIKRMPMEPNSGVWGALLGACRVYGNVELGKEVAELLFALDQSDARNYMMLSNIYSAAGLWKDASKVRTLMKERGLLRNAGSSFIEHGNKVHRFVVGDRSHPESEKIYIKLEGLIGKVREAGVASKTEFVLHDVDEEVREDMINKHSEKLAMAFGLLVTNASMPLIITKNLRICGDCHSFAKLISLIEKRTIIIRDSKRFHNFADGVCSCGDYW